MCTVGEFHRQPDRAAQQAEGADPHCAAAYVWPAACAPGARGAGQDSPPGRGSRQ